jgi:hypothetical protein
MPGKLIGKRLHMQTNKGKSALISLFSSPAEAIAAKVHLFLLYSPK